MPVRNWNNIFTLLNKDKKFSLQVLLIGCAVFWLRASENLEVAGLTISVGVSVNHPNLGRLITKVWSSTSDGLEQKLSWLQLTIQPKLVVDFRVLPNQRHERQKAKQPSGAAPATLIFMAMTMSLVQL